MYIYIELGKHRFFLWGRFGMRFLGWGESLPANHLVTRGISNGGLRPEMANRPSEEVRQELTDADEVD